MTFTPNAVMIPANLVEGFRGGSLSPAEFGQRVAAALGITADRPAPATASGAVVPDGFVEAFLGTCRQRMPNHVPPRRDDVVALLTLYDDPDLLMSMFDYMDWYADDKGPIKTIYGFLRHTYPMNGPDAIRDTIEVWLKKKDTNEGLSVRAAMQDTDALLREVAATGPDLDRIRRMQDAVNERRRKDGITTPAGGPVAPEQHPPVED